MHKQTSDVIFTAMCMPGSAAWLWALMPSLNVPPSWIMVAGQGLIFPRLAHLQYPWPSPFDLWNKDFIISKHLRNVWAHSVYWNLIVKCINYPKCVLVSLLIHQFSLPTFCTNIHHFILWPRSISLGRDVLYNILLDGDLLDRMWHLKWPICHVRQVIHILKNMINNIASSYYFSSLRV